MTQVNRCAGLLLVLVVVHSSTAASIFDVIGSSVSGLVTKQEEVAYRFIRKTKDFEERQYPAQTWVCKQHSGSLTSEAQQQAFLTLFDYLEGGNSINATLDMAIPASVRAPASLDDKKFEACFYPGKKHQKNTPVPTSTKIYLKQRPSMTIFTRKFGGFADTETEWRSATSSLAKLLEGAGEQTQQDHYYWNAFDSPIKFWSRRNEVWILKKD